MSGDAAAARAMTIAPMTASKRIALTARTTARTLKAPMTPDRQARSTRLGVEVGIAGLWLV